MAWASIQRRWSRRRAGGWGSIRHARRRPGPSQRELDAEADGREVFPVELPVGRRPAVRGQHDPPVGAVVLVAQRGLERESSLQAPAHLPAAVLERLGVERGDERSEEHTSELQSPMYLVCRLLLEKKKKINDQVAR